MVEAGTKSALRGQKSQPAPQCSRHCLHMGSGAACSFVKDHPANVECVIRVRVGAQSRQDPGTGRGCVKTPPVDRERPKMPVVVTLSSSWAGFSTLRRNECDDRASGPEFSHNLGRLQSSSWLKRSNGGCVACPEQRSKLHSALLKCRPLKHFALNLRHILQP